jgi:hypothetical protein
VLIRSSLYAHMDGRLDCVLIYNRALTPAEITLLAASRNPFATGPDLSVNGKEPVAAWIPSLDTAGNGTTSLIDLVGDNHGTLTNMDAATDWVADTGAGGVRALDFDGVNDYVGASDTAMPEGAAPRAFSLWVKGTGPTAFKYGTELSGRRVSISAGSSVAVAVNGHNYGKALTPDSDWHHIVVVFPEGATTSDQWLIYHDGVQLTGLINLAGSPRTVNTVLSGNVFFASNGDATYDSCVLDDVRIWDQSLDATDVAALYTRGRGATNVTTPIVAVNSKTPVAAWVPSISRGDWGSTRLTDLVGSNNGTLTNMDAATDWVADTDSGGVRALDFDGVNDYVAAAPGLDFSGDFSISMYIKGSTISGVQALISKNLNLTNNAFVLFLNSGKLGCVTKLSNSQSVGTLHPTVFSVGVWYHVAMIMDSNTVTLYVNGLTPTATVMGDRNNLGVFRIGETNTSFWNSLTGLVDDIRLFDQALDATDVAYLYNSGNGRGRVVEPAPTGVTYHPLSSRSTHPLRFSI